MDHGDEDVNQDPNVLKITFFQNSLLPNAQIEIPLAESEVCQISRGNLAQFLRSLLTSLQLIISCHFCNIQSSSWKKTGKGRRVDFFP